MAVRLLMLDMAWCRVLLSLDHWNVESLECAPGTILFLLKRFFILLTCQGHWNAHVIETGTLTSENLRLSTNWSAPPAPD